MRRLEYTRPFIYSFGFVVSSSLTGLLLLFLLRRFLLISFLLSLLNALLLFLSFLFLFILFNFVFLIVNAVVDESVQRNDRLNEA